MSGRAILDHLYPTTALRGIVKPLLVSVAVARVLVAPAITVILRPDGGVRGQSRARPGQFAVVCEACCADHGFVVGACVACVDVVADLFTEATTGVDRVRRLLRPLAHHHGPGALRASVHIGASCATIRAGHARLVLEIEVLIGGGASLSTFARGDIKLAGLTFALVKIVQNEAAATCRALSF